MKIVIVTACVGESGFSPDHGFSDLRHAVCRTWSSHQSKALCYNTVHAGLLHYHTDALWGQVCTSNTNRFKLLKKMTLYNSSEKLSSEKDGLDPCWHITVI